MKKTTVPFDTFAQLDIRVGEVLDVTPLEESEKLLVLSVDLGNDYGIVEILSGIKQWYRAEDLRGKKYLFAANLEPRRMLNHTSHGMLLAAGDEGKPVLTYMDPSIENGSSIR